MVKQLLEKQKTAIDVFFDQFDTSIIPQTVTKLIQKNEQNKVIYWSGVGKSYNVAAHSSDMIKSMGFVSFPIKPIEALHGDMGSLRKDDLLFVFSKSGNTQELVTFMMHLNKIGVEVIGIFCNPKAKLAKYCSDTIILPCGKEMDNDFDLVPTTSIISFILFVNLLVSYFLKSQDISIFQYGKNHPSGNIGKRIWLTVKDIMYSMDDVCIVEPGVNLLNCMLQMTSKRTGYAIVIKNNEIFGILSDGDIRRYMTTHTEQDNDEIDVNLNISINNLINKKPTTVHQDTNIGSIIEMVNINKALSVGMPVLDDDGHFCGFIDNKLLVKYGNIF